MCFFGPLAAVISGPGVLHAREPLRLVGLRLVGLRLVGLSDGVRNTGDPANEWSYDRPSCEEQLRASLGRHAYNNRQSEVFLFAH